MFEGFIFNRKLSKKFFKSSRVEIVNFHDILHFKFICEFSFNHTFCMSNILFQFTFLVFNSFLFNAYFWTRITKIIASQPTCSLFVF